MHMVAPRTGAPEVTIAENQVEYKPVVAALYVHPQFGNAPVLLTRWRLNDEDRRRIAEGGDLYISLMTFGHPMQPITVQVGPAGWTVPEGEEGHGKE